MADTFTRPRTPLVVGNWKMNTSHAEAEALVRTLLPVLEPLSDVEVVICPPFPWLTDISRWLQGSRISLGAQNMHPEPGGAYTGEVSPRMLKGLCRYVLVGQYERRILFAEKDAVVRRKLQAARQHDLQPILCVGETAAHLDEGLGAYVVAEQLETDLEGLTPDSRFVVAYDPVWTTIGLVAPPPMTYVGDMVAHIRETLASLFSEQIAHQVRVIYGGLVNARTMVDIAAEPRLDGVLAGSASVNSASFATLVRAFSSG